MMEKGPSAKTSATGLQAMLVATDFSQRAAAALHMAQILARPFSSKLILLHVIDQRMLEQISGYLGEPADALLPGFRRRAQQQMDEFLQGVKPGALEVETLVAVGLPFQEIAVVARDLAVDLVVMGGYGRGGRGPLEEVFFGSTAEKVVRLLPCPVLCVPTAATSSEAPDRSHT
ncbi:MAG: universal stress protein [Desulfobaccales bacterium]